ncbi:carboxylesterase family protein [Mycobacterium sp. NBC_00419]|uniref:carboxylesterase/lipase family protein n=1 Tax=Mycobacterium sp. NBC_00419 TaxID=2975989 RepID=UPI002E1B8985
MSLLLVTGCGRGDGESDSSAAATPSPQPTVVHTSGGEVRGVAAPGYRVFNGIPYAASPVGELRWQAPAPVAPWQGVRDATRPGLRCPQDTRSDPDYGRPTGEDCLNLNVWTPDGATPATPRPVMVWIHGGGFLNGSADIYDARWMATQGDIVVVTVNYRLGTLGFLAHPGLSPHGDAGNYGLADQQAALHWVRDNIGAFGGDPAKVTIAGESAGAMSVCDHLVAPGSAGLFRAAILQSGPCQTQADRPTAQRVSLDYAGRVGCPDPATAAQCLRAMPVDRLQRPPLYVGFGADRLTGPVTGTDRLPVDPMTAFALGRVPRVPVLIGTNTDEFTLFVAVEYLRGHGLPPYPKLLADTFGADAAAVGAHYPLQRYDGSTGGAYSAAVTDGEFACPANKMGDSLARSGPVYAYEFNDRTAPAPDPFHRVPFPVGASHGLDLRYLFDIGGAPPLNPAQRELSDQMIGYWSQFVKTGAPDVDGLPDWPQLGADSATGPRLSLQTGAPSVVTDYAARHQCQFWATLKGAR